MKVNLPIPFLYLLALYAATALDLVFFRLPPLLLDSSMAKKKKKTIEQSFDDAETDGLEPQPNASIKGDEVSKRPDPIMVNPQ